MAGVLARQLAAGAAPSRLRRGAVPTDARDEHRRAHHRVRGQGRHLHLILGDEEGGQYVLHPGRDGAHDQISEEFSTKPLSADARAALRKHLLALREDVLPDQPAHADLARYLEALARAPGADAAASAAR